MHTRRFGEVGSNVPARTERVYRVNNEWFFSTRRGDDHGPFDNEEAAKLALTHFLREALEAERETLNTTP